jgi:hypothetical protein
MTEDDILSNGRDDEPRRLPAMAVPRPRVPVVPVLSALVVLLAVALVISLIDRPKAKLAVGSANDTLKIACAELAAVDPEALARSESYQASIYRLAIASTAAQLAEEQDPAARNDATSLEQPTIKLNQTFQVDPDSVRTALKTCKKY